MMNFNDRSFIRVIISASVSDHRRTLSVKYVNMALALIWVTVYL